MQVCLRYLICFFLILLSHLAHAGAWVQKPCEGLSITILRRYLSAQFWTSSGHLTGVPQYAKNEADQYIEFGLTKYVTIGGYYSTLRTRTPTNGIRGGSMDHLFLARFLLWNDDYSALSLQFQADKYGRAAAFDIPPQNTGYSTGEFIWYGKGGKLKTKYPTNWFVDGCIGLVQRYGLHGQVSIILEGGLKFNDEKFWIFLQNFNTISLYHPSGPRRSDYNLLTIAPSIIYWVKKPIGLQLGFAQDFYGKNVGKGTCPFVACWIKF